DADSRRALEKDLGARLTIHMGVETFARAVLGVAERGARFVGATASPDLAGLQRDDRVCVLAQRLGQRFRQGRQRRALSLGAANQLVKIVVWNRPRVPVLKDGGRNRVVPFDLTKSHGLQYFR